MIECWRCNVALIDELTEPEVDGKLKTFCLHCDYCDICGEEHPGRYSTRYYADGGDDINKDEPVLLCEECTERWDIAAEHAASQREEAGE
jgi:hypothetical protein